MRDNELLRLLKEVWVDKDDAASLAQAIKLVEEGKETSDLLGLRGPCLVIPLPAKVKPTDAQREKASRFAKCRSVDELAELIAEIEAEEG